MATEDARKLFVAGLPESISEDVLRQLFEATGGKVVDVSLPRDRATGKVRGFGFVTFSTADEANRGREQLDGSLQSGRSISVRPFSSEPPRRGDRPDVRGGPEPHSPAGPSAGGGGEDRTLYVGNLPYDTTVPEITQVFSDLGVGPVARIHLPSGPDGRLRGFGFVTLASAEAANSAIVALRNADVRGRRLMVNVAHPRGDRPPGGGGGGFGDRPSYGPRPTEPRFPTEPPMAFEGSRPSPDRRARSGGGEPDWSEEAKKKKKRGKGGGAGASTSRTDEDRRRGGGSNWHTWDPDDEE
jgi:RNA recognition motif-containing protein